MIGGFFDRHHAAWGDAELAWFEALLDEDDVDVMAWALQAQPVPEKFAGPQLEALQQLDYVTPSSSEEGQRDLAARSGA